MITQAEYITLAKFRAILRLLSEECEPDMPLSYLTVLAEILIAHATAGKRLELTQSDLLQMLYDGNLNKKSGLTRAIQALSRSDRHAIQALPYDMIETKTDPLNRRRKLIMLTERGRALLANIILILGNNDKSMSQAA